MFVANIIIAGCLICSGALWFPIDEEWSPLTNAIAIFGIMGGIYLAAYLASIFILIPGRAPILRLRNDVLDPGQ